MDREVRKRIEDYFEGFELVELLQIPVEDVIDAFMDKIEEYIDEIEDSIGVHYGLHREHRERSD